MWRTLEAWRAPVGFLEALQGTHVNATTFSACSARVPLHHARGGVMHGDPPSGSMFALGVDPFVRDQDSALSDGESMGKGLARWCADDCGAVTWGAPGRKALRR
eukprot:8051411-Pyramimonas_sp.AAC.1